MTDKPQLDAHVQAWRLDTASWEYRRMDLHDMGLTYPRPRVPLYTKLVDARGNKPVIIPDFAAFYRERSIPMPTHSPPTWSEGVLWWYRSLLYP